MSLLNANMIIPNHLLHRFNFPVHNTFNKAIRDQIVPSDATVYCED